MQTKLSTSLFCSCSDRYGIFAGLCKKTLNVWYGTKNLAVFLFNQVEGFEEFYVLGEYHIFMVLLRNILILLFFFFYSYSLKAPGPTKYSLLY